MYPLVDSEVRTMQEALWWALFTLHRQQDHERTIWFWGKRYKIVVKNNQLLVEPIVSVE